MESLEVYLILGVIALFIFLFIRLLSKPIKGALKFFIHAAMGYVLLFIINFFACNYGYTFDLNLFNAAVAGFLGVPGVILLVLIELFF